MILVRGDDAGVADQAGRVRVVCADDIKFFAMDVAHHLLAAGLGLIPIIT